MDRRRFLQTPLLAFAAYGLIGRAVAADALSAAIRPEALRWLREIAAACQGVRGARLPAPAWQDAIEELFARVPLPDLLAAIDFERLVERLALPDDRAGVQDPQLPDIAGLPARRDCILRVFGMARGRAIIPHGHANMVSAHLVVRGEIRVRHYDRIADAPEAIRLRPTIDRVSRPGDGTTVSDDRDNVHWLVALSPAAYTLDFIVPGLAPERETRWFDFVDIDAAERLPGGDLRAPRLDFDTAIGRYGRDDRIG